MLATAHGDRCGSAWPLVCAAILMLVTILAQGLAAGTHGFGGAALAPELVRPHDYHPVAWIIALAAWRSADAHGLASSLHRRATLGALSLPRDMRDRSAWPRAPGTDG